MNSTDRVMAALSFQEPDVVPRFDSFWTEFTEQWRREKGVAEAPEDEDSPGRLVDAPDILSHYGIDIHIAAADEVPWPSKAAVLERRGRYVVSRDGWGKVTGKEDGSYFYDEIELPLRRKGDLDRLEFEPPDAACRYDRWMREIERQRARPDPPCVFAKVGGPYLRTSNLRGIEQWLVDVAEDPEFASALASKVTDHIIRVGLESLRRADLYDTGIWIYDDIAYNHGVMVGPKLYEKVFVPLMARMIAAFKGAGAQQVVMHSDGDIRSVLDALLDVGLDGINPVEPKANMDAVALRARYGDRLSLVGGVDNAHVLPSGSDEAVRQHVLRVLSAGVGGGLVIGAHSIGPDVSVARYDYYALLVEEHGHYPLRPGLEQ